jgi:hypothetical protein
MLAGMGTTMFSIFLGFLIFIISSGNRLSGASLFLLTTGVTVSILVAAFSALGIIFASPTGFNASLVYAIGTLFFIALSSVFTLAVLAVKQVLEDMDWPWFLQNMKFIFSFSLARIAQYFIRV